MVAGHCCSGKLNTWTVLQLLSWIYNYHYCSHVTIQPSHFRPRQPSCYCPPTLHAAAVERNDLHMMLLWQWVMIPHRHVGLQDHVSPTSGAWTCVACSCPQIIHDESNTPRLYCWFGEAVQLKTAAAAALKLAVASTTSLELKRPTASFIFKLQELRSSIHLARGGSDAHLAAETEVRPERLRLARPSFLFLNRNTRVEKLNNKHNVQRVNLAVKSNSQSGNLQRTSVRWKPKNEAHLTFVTVSSLITFRAMIELWAKYVKSIKRGSPVQY